MKTVEISLGYFKKGDDLYDCVEECGNNTEAISEYLSRMQSVVDDIQHIFKVLDGSDIEIEAGTHYIAITCEDARAQRLVDAGVAYYQEEYED